MEVVKENEQPAAVVPEQEFTIKLKSSQIMNLCTLLEGGLCNMNTLINTLEFVFKQTEGKATHDQMLKDMWDVKQCINVQINEQIKSDEVVANDK